LVFCEFLYQLLFQNKDFPITNTLSVTSLQALRSLDVNFN
jgi:hypothetical protein